MGGRVYRGVASADRQANRRARLLEAGIHLFGTRGYRKTSVKAVCARAGLTERYFYQEFSDREALLVAVYSRIMENVFAATSAAISSHDSVPDRARKGIRAFVEAVTSDRRRARIQLIEVVGVGDSVGLHGRQVMRRFAAQIVEWLGPRTSANGVRNTLVAHALVGGVNELLREWVADDSTLDAEAVVAHAVALFDAADPLLGERLPE